MREGKVTISVTTGSSPSGPADEAVVSLRIEERVSGVVLVSMEITPAEWWRLITGSVRTQVANVPDADQIALIGKQMENDNVGVPKEVYQDIKGTYEPGVYDRSRPEQLDAGKQWAEKHWADIPEPKEIGTRWTNGGMVAYIRHWSEPVPCETCGRPAGDHDYLDKCRKKGS